MKKYFVIALAATAMLSLNSCSNEEELMSAEGCGFISINVSNDDAMVTRDVQSVTNISTWYAKVNNGTSDVYDEAIGTKLATQPFAQGTYSVTVSNYASLSAANTAKDGWGDAYYEKTETGITVTAGQTTTCPIACGTAKNAKFKLNTSGFSGTINEVVVKNSRTVTFKNSEGTLNKEAFFEAGDQLKYTINYTINNITKTTAEKTLTLGGAATVNTLTIKSNSNGTINVTITYNDSFTTGTEASIEFDAATGNETNN